MGGACKRPGVWSRSVLSWHGGLFKFEAVRKIRDLTMSEHSIEQLASLLSPPPCTLKSATVMTLLPKKKGLMSDMIARLEEKATADASQKAYGDKEFSGSCVKKEIKLAELKKLGSLIDTKTAKSAQLKSEVAGRQAWSRHSKS